jgi:hypothetical protein
MTAEALERPATRTARQLPGWQVLALVAGIGAIALTTGPIRDPDVFWHTLSGEYFLHGRSFPHPDPWSFSLPGTHWHSTSWLGEIVLAATYDTGGYAGLVALRLAMGLALVAGLFWLLVRGRTSWPGAVVFVLMVLPLTTYVQERPQTASFLFACWLAHRVRAFLLRQQLPSRWRFVAVTYLWATIHGLFVLGPFCLALLAVGALLDGGRRRLPEAKALLLTAALATGVCAATPLGPRLLLSPLTVGSAARGFISEWAPTQLLSLPAWSLAGVLGLLALAWARGTVPVPRSQVLFVLVLTAFGFGAFRNTGPAALLMAPLAVAAAEQAWKVSGSAPVVLPRTPVLVLAAVALLASLVSYLGKPLLSDSTPTRIADRLRAEPGTVRLLNDYNVSGYLLREAWPKVRLVVDGRAERYGSSFLSDYEKAMQGGPTWKAYVERLHVDYALLRKESALTQLLLASGWTTEQKDRSWLLLKPPV